MKTKIIIIAVLTVLLVVLSSLYFAGVGCKSYDSLIQEELSSYNNRKTFSKLSSKDEKTSYAIAASHWNGTWGAEDRHMVDYLSPLYTIVTKPEVKNYYIGQLLSYPYPLNLSSWCIGIDMPLNVDKFLAGYSQTLKNKVLVPELTGDKGNSYIGYIQTELYSDEIAKKLKNIMKGKGMEIPNNITYPGLAKLVNIDDEMRTYLIKTLIDISLKERQICEMKKNISGEGNVSYKSLEDLNAAIKEEERLEASQNQDIKRFENMLDSCVSVIQNH